MFEKKILKKNGFGNLKKKKSVWESVCNPGERVGFENVLYLI